MEWKYQVLATAWGVLEHGTPEELSEAVWEQEENFLAVYLPKALSNDSINKAHFSFVPYDFSIHYV